MSDSPSSTGSLPSKGDDFLDREFRQSYFKQLVGQLATIGNEVNNPEARKLAGEIAAQKPEAIQWDDIYQLELALIKLEPGAQLRRHAWALRAEYENVAPREYAKYAASKPPSDNPAAADVNELRTDLAQIQVELNWYYTVLWVQESFRSMLIRRVKGMTIKYILSYCLIAVGFICCAGLVLHLTYANWSANPNHTTGGNPSYRTNTGVSETNAASASTNPGGDPAGPEARQHEWWGKVKTYIRAACTYWLVAFAGTLGALISVLRRIQGMSLDGNTDKNLVELEQSSSSIDYAPLLGAVFALLLLFLFLSGILTGSVFPKPSPEGAGFFLGCAPSGCIDVAKVIVWSFIAGFAEKLVPDALDKLQSQSDSKKKEAGPQK